MADALCGPSNALQNFQKHAAVDRSLQQDRIGFRQSPSHSFRSSPAPGPSHVDAEFQAFQTGQPLLREQLPFHPPQQAPQIHAPQPALPNWAADFQQLRLNDSGLASPYPIEHRAPIQNALPPNQWHEEFFRQQQKPTLHHPESASSFGHSAWQPQMPTYAPMSGTSMFPLSVQQPQQEPQVGTAQEPMFDDAAFAKAFQDVDSQIEETEAKGKEKEVEREPVVRFDLSHASMEMGDVTGEYDYEGKGSIWTSELESTLKEAGWDALDAFQRAHEQEFQSTGSQESLHISKTIEKMRTDEERSSHSVTPEPVSDTVRIGADTIPATQQQAEPPSSDAEADELARTAGQLIENLKDEQSTKFQQSNFMQLMRQLRDREVRIEGDSMVKQAPHPGGKFYPADAFVTEDIASGPRAET